MMRALACGCLENPKKNPGGKDTDLKVENFVVVHDHVNRPSELLSVGLCVNLEIKKFETEVFNKDLEKESGFKPSQWGPHGSCTTAR